MPITSSTIAAVTITALNANAKIFLLQVAGALCAFYPKDNPLLPMSSLKMVSTLSNLLFLPSSIITSLGATLTADSLGKLSILAIFAFIINTISYILAFTLGKWLHDGDSAMFTALTVAIGSPNTISFPLLVMQTICDQSIVNVDYENDPNTCYTQASSMIFVYSIGWHIMFWTYGFPTLQTLPKQIQAVSNGIKIPDGGILEIFDKKIYRGSFKRAGCPKLSKSLANSKYFSNILSYNTLNEKFEMIFSFVTVFE